eukprot:Skav206826  [mRNA]  locus=scaffold3672:50143:51893:+ [translate_table: standard]
MERLLRELVADRPAALKGMLVDLGVQTCLDVKMLWGSGRELADEFEERCGEQSKGDQFAVASLWTLCNARSFTRADSITKAVTDVRSSSLVLTPAPTFAKPSAASSKARAASSGGHGVRA